MKNLFYIAIALITLTSCEKEDFGQYHTEREEVYANDPNGGFIYNGTLPTNTVINDLVGTKWLLTKYVSAFATDFPNDTLEFISPNTYTINSGAIRTYQLSVLPLSTNYDLSLYYFFPFGGSHYSGEIGGTFIDDGEIKNAEFQDIQNSSSTIRAWFVKLP